MNTDKKNQHYIPKFYLRNFSYNNNHKQLGIYYLQTQFYFQTAKLKTQGSKNFFYGYDGEIEDQLEKVESHLGKSLKIITEKHILPIKGSPQHVDLLVFVALTHLRNPVLIQNMIDLETETEKRIIEQDPDTDIEKLNPKIAHNDRIKIALSGIPHIIQIIEDLDYKLLLNKTNTPFLGSDFPVVKYNQFLEQRNWQHGKTGYGNIGLQIIIPLNSKISIFFFDSGIYKVGFKKRRIHEIENKGDIDQLNILQFLNCFETIYFNHEGSKEYLHFLHEKSKKYGEANVSKSSLHHLVKSDQKNLIKPNEKKKNLIVTGITDCEIKLKINGIKQHSKGKATQLSSSVAQLRPLARRRLEINH